jgi:Family of unknown function (DUF6339)
VKVKEEKKLRLQELELAATTRLDEQFRVGAAAPDVGDFCRPFGGGREVDLTAASGVVEEALRRFAAKDRAASDSWLGPRLHAALRLSRREASRPGVWRYLGVCVFPDYVRWRFAAEKNGSQIPVPLERFIGAETKHALARLWWMAEMFRNGADYKPAAKALSNQDVINNMFKNDTAHHRPTAQGAVRVLVPGDGKPALTGREANALAKAINTTAATVLLDSFAPDEPLDDAARIRWIELGKDHDPALYFEGLPEGPDDPVAPTGSVEQMETLLIGLLEEAPVRGKEKTSD